MSTFPIMMREWLGSLFFNTMTGFVELSSRKRELLLDHLPLYSTHPTMYRFMSFGDILRREELFILKRKFGAPLLILIHILFFLSMFSIVFSFYVILLVQMEYAKFKGLSKGAHHVSKAILSSLGMQLKYYVQIHYKNPHFFFKGELVPTHYFFHVLGLDARPS